MLDKIAAVINTSDNIAILPHVAADGDALGSSLALAMTLVQMGQKAVVLLEEDIPLIYGFLPGKELSEVYASGSYSFDLAVALDCGDAERLGLRKSIFSGAAKTVNIDHHATNKGFAVYNHVDTGSSATGEIIFRLLEYLKRRPDRDIAACLYTAISTDTGGFRYSNTTPLTHRTAAELIGFGVDVAEVSRSVFDTASLGKVRLTGAAIESLELFENGRLAIMTVTNEMIRNAGAVEEDSDGIINTARNIRGVEAAAMLKQLESGEIKVNLRSNSYVDVSDIAARHSGGGHKRAAGFTVKGDLEQVKLSLLSDLKEVL